MYCDIIMGCNAIQDTEGNNMVKFSVIPISMISKDNMQRIRIEYESTIACHYFLSLYFDGKKIVPDIDVAFESGIGHTYIMLPAQERELEVIAALTDKNGKMSAKSEFLWTVPQKRTFSIMISSHTDIGLHNSQYIQRQNSSTFLDDAMKICDNTASFDENDQYRYAVEGTWFWNNYGAINGEDAAKAVVKNYIKKGKIDVFSGLAGNHIQVYGLEEMCRSTYERTKLEKKWDIHSETLAMIDNNGLPMSMIQPYCEAGYKNIIFSPNHWNPIPSKIWHCNTSKKGYKWNCDASGGGARIDFRYSSNLPLLFFWEDNEKNRLLVWGACQYEFGSTLFGISPYDRVPIEVMENAMSDELPNLDRKYPYDSWLLVCYSDDQKPTTTLIDSIKAWNEKWSFPRLNALGNTDELFEHMREKYSDIIPVVKGDFTGGWYQHPISAADLLSDKFEADRLLPAAEKFSTIAALIDDIYEYPDIDFDRAWYSLLLNDEHSYGTSGYQGRRVYETWMQHRDWIEKAAVFAKEELNRATRYLASKIASKEDKTVVFNPTNIKRQELIEISGGYKLVNVPEFGYMAIVKSDFSEYKSSFEKCTIPPTVENEFYIIKFGKNGSIKSVYDKSAETELVDLNNRYSVNEFIYTNDNHKTYFTPENAEFELFSIPQKTVVSVKTVLEPLGAELLQTITIPNYDKRIDIENNILHARDMINNNRYLRYLYCAFPFLVENSKRICHLNGCRAEYAKDVSGYCTDVYMAVNEWCCVENETRGVALVVQDSCLMEFDHIHPDKTDFNNAGENSQMFAYIANDWLQMHSIGGSHLNYTFRFSIISYQGTYQSANVPKRAELILNPVVKVDIGRQDGILKKDSDSFAVFDNDLRLLTLKPAENGKGIIGRFYGKDPAFSKVSLLGKDYDALRNTVNEQYAKKYPTDGFLTYRIGKNDIQINKKKPAKCQKKENEPMPIGSVYTGLISYPRATHGEKDGQLYLLWGANTEKDFSHYKLYRGTSPDFDISDETFVADIYPEVFCVGRYVDENLEKHKCYYYRVCAVSKSGICGKFSDEFQAYTKE